MRSISVDFIFIAIAFAAFSAQAGHCLCNDSLNCFLDLFPFFFATASNESCSFSGNVWKAPVSVDWSLLLFLPLALVTKHPWLRSRSLLYQACPIPAALSIDICLELHNTLVKVVKLPPNGSLFALIFSDASFSAKDKLLNASKPSLIVMCWFSGVG